MKLAGLVEPRGALVATDGSRRGRALGWAWLSDVGGWALRARMIPRWQRVPESANLPELAAVHLALTHHGHDRDELVEILSDCEAALAWAARWCDEPGVTVPGFDTLGLLKRRPISKFSLREHRPTLTWTAGHAGHPLNEGADALARLASRAERDGLTDDEVRERAQGLADAFSAAHRAARVT